MRIIYTCSCCNEHYNIVNYLNEGTIMKEILSKNLFVGYGEELVIKDINLSLSTHQIISIIGPNGCGKSTLLKSIANIIPYKGEVWINDQDIQVFSRKHLAKILAMLPQKPEATRGLTVEELVMYGRHPYVSRFGAYDKKDYEMVHWAMTVTGVEDYKDKDINALSGGQKQRVWIALCLAQDTEIIFLDEPTTYLDIAHQLEILEILDVLKNEHQKTIVMVLHDLNQASKYSDYLIAMKDGVVVKEGSSEEVITEEVLLKLFNIQADIVLDKVTQKPMCLSFNLVK